MINKMTPKNAPGSLLDSSGTSLAAFSPSAPTAPTSKPFGNDISLCVDILIQK